MKNRLYLFGRPRLSAASGVQPHLSPSAWRLIAIVASAAPDGVTRTELQRLLWPAGKPGTLRKLLWDIRVVERSHDITILESDEGTVRLSDSIYCDLLDLGAPQPEREPSRVYREPFAEGLDADHDAWTTWIAAQRQRLRGVYIERATAGLLDPAVGRSTRRQEAVHLLDVDPTNEAAVRALMSNDAMSGDTDAVLRVYSELRSRLESAGGRPHKSTTALFFRLTASRRARETSSAVVENPEVPTICILKPKSRRRARSLRLAQSLVVDVTIGLCRISLFKVTAPHTAWQLSDLDHATRLHDLKVKYVVETDLLDHASGAEQIVFSLYALDTRQILWSDKIDVESRLSVESYNILTTGILRSLTNSIDTAELSAFSLQAESSSYSLYLAGQSSLASLDLRTLRRGRQYLREAFEQSPSFSPAASALARSHQLEWIITARGDADLLFRSERYAHYAINADPYEARGYRELGFCSLYTKQYDLAMEQYRIAEHLNPQYADLLADYADGLIHYGDISLALEKITRAIDLNPLCQDTYMWTLGAAYYFLGRYPEAIATLKNMTDEAPVQRLLAAAHALNGDARDAARCRVETMKTHPSMTVDGWVDILPIRDRRQAEHYREGLKAAGFT